MFNDAIGFKKVYLAVGTTDLRKGIDGLAAIVKFQFNLDPYNKNTLFLFCGKKPDRIKGLVWEGDGFLPDLPVKLQPTYRRRLERQFRKWERKQLQKTVLWHRIKRPIWCSKYLRRPCNTHGKSVGDNRLYHRCGRQAYRDPPQQWNNHLNTYNETGQLTAVTDRCDNCKETLGSYRYTYDAAGRITAEETEEPLYALAAFGAHGIAHEDKAEQGNDKNSVRKQELKKPESKIQKSGNTEIMEESAGNAVLQSVYSIVAARKVKVKRSFNYDVSGNLLTVGEEKENRNTEVYTFRYDAAGRRTGCEKTVN